jgi:uncharacterized protein (DUF58 family)
VIATALGATVTALLTGYPQLIVLAAGCLAALAAALVFTVRLHPELSCAWDAPRVTEGTPGVLRVGIRNTSGRGLEGLGVTVQSSEVPGRPPLAELEVPWIGRRSHHESRTALPLPRDVHVVRSLEVEVTDPLGLIRRRFRTTADATLVVHPEIDEPGPDDLRAAEDDAGRTSARGRRQGASAFHAVRPYQPGDDLRHVHWFATARSDELMVQDMVVPVPSRQVLLLDTSAAAYPDARDFETAVRICASIAVAALRTQELVLVTTDGTTTSRHRSRGARTAVLDTLAAIHRTSDDPRPVSVPRFGGGAAVTLVTGSAADHGSWPPALRRSDVTVIRAGEADDRGRRSGHGPRELTAASLQEFARIWGPAWSD